MNRAPTSVFRVLPRAACVGAVVAAGCQSPFDEQSSEQLRQSVLEAAQREIEASSEGPGAQPLSRDQDIDQLGIRPEHLEEIREDYNPDRYFLPEDGSVESGPEAAGEQIQSLIGENLFGEPTEMVPIGLYQAVRGAVERNLNVQSARFEPAISEARIVEAEAAFDWVFFNDFAWVDTDTPQPGPGFLNLDRTVQSNQTVRNETGLRRTLETGGTFSLSQELVYSDERGSAFGTVGSPNPASQANYTVDLTQPLLRNFGSDVALSQVRLERNAERRSISELRRRLIDTVTEVEQAYWELVRAHRELVISSKLLERGIEVRDEITARRVLDAVQAEIADAVATVEARRGDILRAQRGLRRASDQLKALINDPRLPVGSEVLLVPGDAAIDEPIEYSLLSSVSTAIQRRPEVQQAIIAIDDASIREVVARNARLPIFDLRASGVLRGFGSDFDNAFEDAPQNEFIDDFTLGALFEQPLGNRAGEAQFRRRRLERLQSVVNYRRTVQDVVLDVKNAIDNVVTDYKLIAQARTTRIAEAEALRTLLVEKELTEQGFTVERLDLEFTQQEALARAEREEVDALIDYNVAIAELYRAMGTALERNRINFVVPDLNQIAEGEAAVDYSIDFPIAAPERGDRGDGAQPPDGEDPRDTPADESDT